MKAGQEFWAKFLAEGPYLGIWHEDMLPRALPVGPLWGQVPRKQNFSELMRDHTNRTEKSLVLAQESLGRALRRSLSPVRQEHG